MPRQIWPALFAAAAVVTTIAHVGAWLAIYGVATSNYGLVHGFGRFPYATVIVVIGTLNLGTLAAAIALWSRYSPRKGCSDRGDL